jgi:hypothetical protein
MIFIAFTGGNSWVAQEISEYIKTKSSEIEIVLLIRNVSNEYHSLNKFSKNDFDRFDFVFHLAHDYKINENTAKIVIDEFREFLQSSNTNNFLLSSMSASKKNPSNYSSFKLQLEMIFEENYAGILRPGLIYKNLENREYSKPLQKFSRIASFLPFSLSAGSSYYLTSINSIGDAILSIIDKGSEVYCDSSKRTNIFDFGPLDFSELQRKVGINRSFKLILPATFVKKFYIKFKKFIPEIVRVDKAVNLIAGMYE